MTASASTVIDRIVVPLSPLPTDFGYAGIVSSLSQRGQGPEAAPGLTVAGPPNFDYSLLTWAGRLFIIALATAAMAAMMTGSVAHDEFGISLDTIRTDALSAAGYFCGRRLRVLTTRKR